MTDSPLPGTLRTAATPEFLADALAQWLVELSAAAVASRGRFTVALAGGSTPRLLYARLADQALAAQIDWSAWWCFFGDERAAPPTDPNSNYAMASETLLQRVPVNPAQVQRMAAERPDLDTAAAEYAATMTQLLGASPGAAPVLDCVLLGLGENGHTASLFPDTAALTVRHTWCTRGLADYIPFDRLTLTYPVLNSARHVAFMVTGGGKRDALHGVREGTVPAAHVRPSPGELHWFLDHAAADTLTP